MAGRHHQCYISFRVVFVYFRFLFLLYYLFFYFSNWDNLFGQALCGDGRLLLLGKLDRGLPSRRGTGQQKHPGGCGEEQGPEHQWLKKNILETEGTRHFAATNSLSWLRPSCEAWTCLHLSSKKKIKKEIWNSWERQLMGLSWWFQMV